MAKNYEVLEMLRPNGGWVMVGDDYEGIEFIDCEPLTKKEFEDGLIAVEKWRASKELDQKTKKDNAQKKLLALGLTLDDLTALGL
jgi:hypothetical protein